MSFGGAAEAYERFRPGYPAALVDEVLAYADRPVRSAFEIGAGTGKATRVFAERGIAVTASDPDAEMLDELRTHVPANVTTVLAPFEKVPLDRAYDLVLAAASLHWTRPEGRWERIAALLTAGGTFASFGGPTRLADPELAEAVRAARAGFLEDDDVPSPDGTQAHEPMQWPGTELIRSGRFADVRQVVLEQRIRMPSGDFVGLLSTISAYLVLPEGVRRQALGAIRHVLPETVDVDAAITAHLARTP